MSYEQGVCFEGVNRNFPHTKTNWLTWQPPTHKNTKQLVFENMFHQENCTVILRCSIRVKDDVLPLLSVLRPMMGPQILPLVVLVMLEMDVIAPYCPLLFPNGNTRMPLSPAGNDHYLHCLTLCWW